MSPEDEAELEQLRRDVEVLGGDPNAVLARAQNTPYVSRAPFYNDGQGVLTDQERGLGAGSSFQSRQSPQPGGQGARSFRDVGTSRYEYIDPSAPGAAPGEQVGPMSDELKHLGVVKPGPQGYDMVDTAALGFKNASATGELAREVEALRSEVAALGGNPDAVLSRVNKPAPKPRQGRTVAGDVDIGDVTTETDTSDYDLTTLEGAGRYNQDTLRGELRAKEIAANRAMYNEARANGFDLPPLPAQVETTREYDGPRQLEEIDFDQRQEDELRAMAMYGTTDAERQRNIRRALDQSQMEGDHLGVVRYRPTAPGSVVNNLNTGQRTGRTVGNVSEDEVRRALQRREELFL